MRIALSAKVAILLFSSLLGCHVPWQRAPQNYMTVPADIHHDKVKAIASTNKAAKHMTKNRITEAEQCLHDALIADVSYGPAHNNLGLIYYEQGKYYLAAWEFEFARSIMPSLSTPSNNLGMVFEAVDRLDEAVEHYEVAYLIDPRNPEIIGNLTRARLKRNDRDPQTQRLLADLVISDTRPDWTAWAREQLAVTNWTTCEGLLEKASSNSVSDDYATPEVVPLGPIVTPDLPTNPRPSFGLPHEYP